ncbi:hypothetical protein D770_23320 [Flammeovirgaceae bacterium 311]|nr:hypothetical protein D770_23320 [Flammeovirgaceae bacterium 311]
MLAGRATIAGGYSTSNAQAGIAASITVFYTALANTQLWMA